MAAMPARRGPPIGTGDLKTWHDHVFLFDNPKGPHREYWQHVLGCRQWLVLERNTATNEVGASRPARDKAPAMTRTLTRRLPQGGRIDRKRPIAFTLDGRRLEGFAGDTLASALMAAGVTLVGRSFKLHRPRGLLSAGVEEPNALFTLGEGDRREPNIPATMTDLMHGLVARRQNAWPSVELDLMAVNSLAAPLLTGGVLLQDLHGSPPRLLDVLRALHPPGGWPGGGHL